MAPWLHAKGGHAKRVVLIGPVHNSVLHVQTIFMCSIVYVSDYTRVLRFNTLHRSCIFLDLIEFNIKFTFSKF